MNKKPKYNSIIEVARAFANEDVCKAHLEKLRWNGEITCPFCTHEKVYKTDRGYKCADKECKKKFTVTVGTIFENSKIPLSKWFVAIYLCTSHKKGVSSCQLAKDIDVTQKTAWFILHRIREMLKEKAPHMLNNVVEVDEAYIGGKEKNKHANKRTKNSQGRFSKSKATVIGLVERGGKVVARHVEDAGKKSLLPVMVENITPGATVYTDEWNIYRHFRGPYTHRYIKHNSGQYVDGDIHTNTIENFWSHLKRGLHGTYHKVSPGHLQRYCDEFAFRFNSRKLTEEERINDVVVRASGVRLKYWELKIHPRPNLARRNN